MVRFFVLLNRYRFMVTLLKKIWHFILWLFGLRPTPFIKQQKKKRPSSAGSMASTTPPPKPEEEKRTVSTYQGPDRRTNKELRTIIGTGVVLTEERRSTIRQVFNTAVKKLSSIAIRHASEERSMTQKTTKSEDRTKDSSRGR